MYPDPKHWRILPKNHLKKIFFGGRLGEHKIICKNMGENKKFFCKCFSQKFRENFHKNENF
jgi:hypothetical protein